MSSTAFPVQRTSADSVSEKVGFNTRLVTLGSEYFLRLFFSLHFSSSSLRKEVCVFLFSAVRNDSGNMVALIAPLTLLSSSQRISRGRNLVRPISVPFLRVLKYDSTFALVIEDGDFSEEVLLRAR